MQSLCNLRLITTEFNRIKKVPCRVAKNNKHWVDILVSRNPDSGNMETGIPERKPPLIGLINTHKESNECQAQSRFAGA